MAEPGWNWFEEGLIYDNAKLAHALIVSGRATGQSSVYERGLRALRWLVGTQTSPYGQLRPIGSNGFYKRNGARADFDQQPIEAQSTVSACLEACRATADPWWYERAQGAFDWFLGWNDLGLEHYCAQTGGCRDGLHPDRGNENWGGRNARCRFCCRLRKWSLYNAPRRALSMPESRSPSRYEASGRKTPRRRRLQ